MQIAAVALYGWPVFMVGGNGRVVETEKAIVSADNASITLSGVRIDVNPLNLIDGEKELIVSRKKQSVDNLPDEASIGYKPVYVTGKLPCLPLVTIVYRPEARVSEQDPWNFSFCVYPVWED